MRSRRDGLRSWRARTRRWLARKARAVGMGLAEPRGPPSPGQRQWLRRGRGQREGSMSVDGLTVCSSSFGPTETMDRLTAAVTGRGMAILARIDHAAAAAAAGMPLRPTEVLIF